LSINRLFWIQIFTEFLTMGTRTTVYHELDFCPLPPSN